MSLLMIINNYFNNDANVIDNVIDDVIDDNNNNNEKCDLSELSNWGQYIIIDE